MQSTLNDLTILFMSILLEALPFIMLGSIIASLISLFVTDDLLYRFIPKNRFGGLLAVSLLGIAFPVCDCTVIPIMRRLIRKGLPPSLAVTFMCAVPIVNPAVILSTTWAFTNQPHIIWMRLFVGMWTAIAAGYIIGKITGEADPLRKDNKPQIDNEHAHNHEESHGCNCGHSHDNSPPVNKHNGCECGSHEHVHNHEESHGCSCGHSHDNSPPDNKHNGCACGSHEHVHNHEESHGCSCGHSHDNSPRKQNSRLNKVSKGIHSFLAHTTSEFIESGSLIVIGAFLSAAIQMLIPRTIMYPVSSSPAASVGGMMIFTWLISLCANADAFVAKSFYGLFTTGSVIAFMTFGQMIDLKNTVVLFGFFRKRFVLITSAIIVTLCFAWGLAINLLGRGL
jgi:uncharacterized membrane protein YraQ (UPF0718 family)